MWLNCLLHYIRFKINVKISINLQKIIIELKINFLYKIEWNKSKNGTDLVEITLNNI